jgi:hypothetical protein
MNANRKTAGSVVLAFLLGVGTTFLFGVGQPGTRAADADKPGTSPRYTILRMDPAFMLVTDNQTNKFYYYAMDEGQEPGSELRLHSTVDLTQVGKPTIKAEPYKPDAKKADQQ